MPNHVENQLRVKGPRADVLRFAALSTQGYFVPSGDREKAAARSLVLARPEWVAQGEFSFGALTGIDEDYADNWRDFAMTHWGTKWDAYNVTLDGDADAPGRVYTAAQDAHVDSDGISTLDLTFQKAWSPPDKWLEAATQRFPTLTFMLTFCDEMPNFVGYFVARDGRVRVEEYDQATELIPAKWGPEDSGDSDEFLDAVNEWWTEVWDELWDRAVTDSKKELTA